MACLFDVTSLFKQRLGFCQLEPSKQTCVQFQSKHQTLIYENTFEYIFCEMAAILCRERWVDVMYKRRFVTHKIIFSYTLEIPFERKLNLQDVIVYVADIPYTF